MMLLVAAVHLIVLFCGGHVDAFYTINMTMSNDVISEGSQVTLTCNVTNDQNTSYTLVWVKRVGSEELSIGSNAHVSEPFGQTRRYHLGYLVIKQLTNIKFTLTISDAKSADAGEIGCRIPVHGIELFKNLSVLVPVQSVRLMSRNVDNSHAQSYADGRQVTFVDGEVRRVMCRVNGSHPVPSVRVFLGERDVTADFTATTNATRIGPSMPKGPASVYYSTDLYNPAMRVGFELSGKSLRCVANVPGSNFSDVSTSIVIAFASYRPKFINCNGPVVTVPRYKSQVRLTCDVQAEPPASLLSVRWQRSDGKSVQLAAGSRDGHYLLTLDPIPDSQTKKMTMKMDKVYPQHFRNYTFTAQNAVGSTDYELQLVEECNVDRTQCNEIESGGKVEKRYACGCSVSQSEPEANALVASEGSYRSGFSVLLATLVMMLFALIEI